MINSSRDGEPASVEALQGSAIPEGFEAINAIAWRDCCLWAFDEPGIREQFRIDTGVDLDSVSSPMDRLIDGATGEKSAGLAAFVSWFNRFIWGNDMVPEKIDERGIPVLSA